MSHKHRAKTARYWASPGCVNPRRCNPAAHGGSYAIEECRCGATRRANTNGKHKEFEPWDADETTDKADHGQ